MRKVIDIRQEELSDRLYPLLQQRSEEYLNGLSGKLWNNFNPHDPGVTTNDILNYILTDLDYRLHYNLEDYLNTEKGRLDLKKVGLINRIQLGLTSPVTPQDYEKLVLKNIPEVCHIEFTALTQPGLLGMYDVKAFISPDAVNVNQEDVKAKILTLFYNNRNLCEDIRSVNFSDEPCSYKHESPPDISRFLNDNRQSYPKGEYRNIYDYLPARMEFPAFYGINDWGLSPDVSDERLLQAEQLKAYLSLFDQVVTDGLAEIKDIPRWFGMNTTLAAKDGLELKMSLLNNFDRIYGEDSNPSFMKQPGGGAETPQKCIKRRIDFLRLVPFWGRDRHKATFLNNNEVYGLEAYIRKLLLLESKENMVVLEHIFLRDADTPDELALSVFFYGETKRMGLSSFREGLEVLVLKRVPAHLSAFVYWLTREEGEKLEVAHTAFLNERSLLNITQLKNVIKEIKEKRA